MKEGTHKPMATTIVDDEDGDEIADVEEETPTANSISVDTKALPSGYAYKKFLRLNGCNTAYRHRSESGANLPSRNYKHGCLIPKDIAPPLMIEHANNPNKTCIDPDDGKLKYHVEEVIRIVKISNDGIDEGVIHTESGEVPYRAPVNPYAFIGRQPLRPEQVIVNGLRAKAEAKAAAATQKKK